MFTATDSQRAAHDLYDHLAAAGLFGLDGYAWEAYAREHDRHPVSVPDPHPADDPGTY